MIDLIAAGTTIAPTAVDLGLLVTALLLGVRHGIDWDHIAAITDITSTTAAAGMGDAAHAGQHRDISGHAHGHGGDLEMRAHDAGPGGATLAPALATRPTVGRTRFLSDQADAIRLGTLYALGHGLVVDHPGPGGDRIRGAPAGLARPAHGPDRRVHPGRPRRVGPLLDLSLRPGGRAFRLRSRWMLVFDGIRYGWRRLQARLHGHEHVEPLEMSSYGARTSFGVGMIHGIGAETGSQVLLIAAVGGASAAGLGVPMLFAFVIGLLLSNFVIVLISSASFVSSQARERLYVSIGAVAGLFSLFVGTIFLFGLERLAPRPRWDPAVLTLAVLTAARIGRRAISP